MSPTPYYEDDAVTIYHGDALEILDGLDVSIDVVITDPPYGPLRHVDGGFEWGAA